jgi:cation transport regulator
MCAIAPTLRPDKPILSAKDRRPTMPYRTISDLPQAQTDQYTEHQKEVFLKAFNNAYKEYGGDESRAFAVAHAAAKKAPQKAHA